MVHVGGESWCTIKDPYAPFPTACGALHSIIRESAVHSIIRESAVHSIIRESAVHSIIRESAVHSIIRESVDSLCRDGADTPIVCVHWKAFLTSERSCSKPFWAPSYPILTFLYPTISPK